LALAALEQESRLAQLAEVAQETVAKLEIGYRRNTESGAPLTVRSRFSVPIFENKGKVKMARQQLLTLS
jgi:multidrug efflux pump subunit AcrA (membrane-fusion protein)